MALPLRNEVSAQGDVSERKEGEKKKKGSLAKRRKGVGFPCMEISTDRRDGQLFARFRSLRFRSRLFPVCAYSTCHSISFYHLIKQPVTQSIRSSNATTEEAFSRVHPQFQPHLFCALSLFVERRQRTIFS